MWQSREHPHLRVVVVGRKLHESVNGMVFWDGDLEGLKLLFTYETSDRWNINADGAVYGSPGIDRDRLWRDSTDDLVVEFDRTKFGGPDTWHIGHDDANLPFFEPIRDPRDPRDPRD